MSIYYLDAESILSSNEQWKKLEEKWGKPVDLDTDDSDREPSKLKPALSSLDLRQTTFDSPFLLKTVRKKLARRLSIKSCIADYDDFVKELPNDTFGEEPKKQFYNVSGQMLSAGSVEDICKTIDDVFKSVEDLCFTTSTNCDKKRPELVPCSMSCSGLSFDDTRDTEREKRDSDDVFKSVENLRFSTSSIRYKKRSLPEVVHCSMSCSGLSFDDTTNSEREKRDSDDVLKSMEKRFSGTSTIRDKKRPLPEVVHCNMSCSGLSFDDTTNSEREKHDSDDVFKSMERLCFSTSTIRDKKRPLPEVVPCSMSCSGLSFDDTTNSEREKRDSDDVFKSMEKRFSGTSTIRDNKRPLPEVVPCSMSCSGLSFDDTRDSEQEKRNSDDVDIDEAIEQLNSTIAGVANGAVEFEEAADSVTALVKQFTVFLNNPMKCNPRRKRQCGERLKDLADYWRSRMSLVEE
ncbi:uncharacterized protein LOC114358307 [Ostrinia furnacalis]|uniref:uncharacterized protein LOC114358307 n=1 Tax=Ostrinia furnacalis TaxID=93504 RepID=UPI00103F0383|nr:uncharacterized protein LOC114358307 [Ostrinia furnacalis]